MTHSKPKEKSFLARVRQDHYPRDSACLLNAQDVRSKQPLTDPGLNQLLPDCLRDALIGSDSIDIK